ncbi:uncharacterized protein LACBIDRAFT_254568, partial [Laccaria bicolor S238N-H82]
TAKRKKVNHACLYCRRSHMTCDDGRPCQRCIKREIGHLCHDEHRSRPPEAQPATTAASSSQVRTSMPGTHSPLPQATSAWPMVFPQSYQPQNFGNEFSVLTHVPALFVPNLSSHLHRDFLETLDDGFFFTPPTTVAPALISNPFPTPTEAAAAAPITTEVTAAEPPPVLLPADKTEKFLLTAADQESGSRDERLNRVIRSKYEAGLLKPYNYVKGYARLSRWMENNVSQESKQAILQPLSILRPKFRAVAQSLRDLDLVFIEEAFERMLLDYDRVFLAMGIPACLWRRTGEIYKGNRAFTELIGLDGHLMRDGRLCIYQLMAEESAVNYWEKYGHVAFDSSQKAVLTSCIGTQTEEGFINCCFSFTIRSLCDPNIREVGCMGVAMLSEKSQTKRKLKHKFNFFEIFYNVRS